MTDKKDAPEGTESKMSAKKKVILALLGVTVLAGSWGTYSTLKKEKRESFQRNIEALQKGGWGR